MKTVVVYDSVYGNTGKIAQAIAGAVIASGEPKLVRAREANPSAWGSVDLLFIGSPTVGGRPTPAIRKLIGEIPPAVVENARVVTFDTRMTMAIARFFGYAAVRMAEDVKRRGGHLAAEPEGFIVEGREGPLKEGELERAAAWARGLSASTK